MWIWPIFLSRELESRSFLTHNFLREIIIFLKNKSSFSGSQRPFSGCITITETHFWPHQWLKLRFESQWFQKEGQWCSLAFSWKRTRHGKVQKQHLDSKIFNASDQCEYQALCHEQRAFQRVSTCCRLWWMLVCFVAKLHHYQRKIANLPLMIMVQGKVIQMSSYSLEN